MTSSSLDACLTLVADSRRRYIIQYLRSETDGTARFKELVDRLAGERDDCQNPDPGQLAIELQHNHLPMLVDHGVVEYDDATGMVEYRSSEYVETVLDALPEEVTMARV